MNPRWRRTLPVEAAPSPLRGFKLGYPLLSADGRRTAFRGLTIGAQQVYGPWAEATCVWSRRHHCPQRRCGCGFYCLHTAEAGWALACDSRYRSAALLEVAASGRFIRYEHGLRYSRQRVAAVRIGRCRCGRLAQLLVDTGHGQAGWRELGAACTQCAGWRPTLSFVELAARAGGELAVTADARAPALPPTPAMVPMSSIPLVAGGPGEAEGHASTLAVLAAEIVLLQARLDTVQTEFVRLSGRSG